MVRNWTRGGVTRWSKLMVSACKTFCLLMYCFEKDGFILSNLIWVILPPNSNNFLSRILFPEYLPNSCNHFPHSCYFAPSLHHDSFHLHVHPHHLFLNRLFSQPIPLPRGHFPQSTTHQNLLYHCDKRGTYQCRRLRLWFSSPTKNDSIRIQVVLHFIRTMCQSRTRGVLRCVSEDSVTVGDVLFQVLCHAALLLPLSLASLPRVRLPILRYAP